MTAKLFIEATNRAVVDGDTRLVRRLFVKDCENCERTVGAIEALYSRGGSAQGPIWTDVELGAPVRGNQGQLGVPVRVVAAEQSIQESASSSPTTQGSGQRKLLAFTLVQRSGRWMITTLLNKAA